MTLAKEALLETLTVADGLCSSTDLQDVQVAGSPDPGAAATTNRHKQFFRRGVMVGCFAAFEEFVLERTKELAHRLSLAALPASAFPDSMLGATRAPAVNVLQSLMSRESSAAQAAIAVRELAAAWTSEESGAAWTVPHLAFRWPTNNLSSGALMTALSAIGTASDWSDITGVVQATGVPVLPTKAAFDDIANERHRAAHDANAMVDIVALSPIPRHLVRLSFAVDALLSVGAARIIHRSPDVKRGRQAIALTRIVRRPGTTETWAQYSGPIRAQPQRAAKLYTEPLADVLDAVAQTKSGPADIICVLDTDAAGKPELIDWRVLGI